MRLVLFIGSLKKGGSERVIANIADFMAERGHCVTLLTQYSFDDEFALNKNVKRCLTDIAKEEVTKSRIVNFYRRFMKLYRSIRREKPDAVLSFIGTNNLMAILTTKFMPYGGKRPKVVVSERGDPDFTYPTRLLKFLARFLFCFADLVVLQTGGSRDFFPAKVNKKSVILRNPVNQKFFRPRFEGEREKTIVSVGRIDENKNQRLLLQAFSKLAGTYPDYQLIIYGEGNLKETLKQEADILGLAERIKFPGKSSTVEEDIYKAGIFVLSSDTEGSPNSLIEAMLLGLAVISTDCPSGGPKELIKHGYNGLLTPPKDLDKLTENLQYMLSNFQMAAEMGRNAAKLQKDFDPDIVYGAWEEILRSDSCGN
ncbi:MAG: glycosyltransferase [Lachnospiraceae bacterium]|nr:glycosyltransferase [Lachnospiraceae bacterium]